MLLTTPQKENKYAVIYCRVSTKEQAEEGNSLTSQERNCREYALKTGYDISEVFVEQGESAKTQDRTELKRLLSYCTQKKHKIQAVIIYKLDRISRNTDDYSQIRLLLKRYGVEIKSTTEYFENTPAGRFMENIIANVAQFDNDVRTERSVGGMKEAMREGRYVWMASVGYDNVKIAGKATIHPNPMAPLVKAAFEEVSQNLVPVEEIRRKLNKKGLVSKNGRPLVKSHFFKMLRNVVYSGQIVKLGERHRGTFVPLITEELFEQVQWVLKHRTRRNYKYEMENPDFPLRRFVVHKQTNKKLTGSWAQGRNEKYPYYRFMEKGLNFKKKELEKVFLKFLDKYRLNEKHLKEFLQKVKENIIKEQDTTNKDCLKFEQQISNLKEKQTKLIQKNFDGVINDTLLRQQLALIEREVFALQVALSEKPRDRRDIGELMPLIREFLKNPSKIWAIAGPEEKVQLQWFEFPKGVLFDNGKLQTGEICKLFKLKSELLGQKFSKVPSKNKTTNRKNIKKSQKRLKLKPAKAESVGYWNRITEEIIRVSEILNSEKNETEVSDRIQRQRKRC